MFHKTNRDLEDLAQQSGPLYAHSAGKGTVKSVQFKSISDLYPVNSRTSDMEKCKKAIERHLRALAHQTMGVTLCGMII